MMIMARVSGDISLFFFIFILLGYVCRLYKALGCSLWIVDRIARGVKTQLVHRNQQYCHQVTLSFQDLFQNVVVVVDLSVLLA